MADANIDISVVIPAYNGERTIADCLDSLERATRGRRCETIVVDSSPGEAAARIVRQRFPSVVLIRTRERLSAGGARNRGAAAACGRLICFTDQDCIVPPDWIDRLEKHLADPAVAAAGGAVGIRNFSNWSGCALYFLEFLNHFPADGPPRRNEKFLVGCNCCCRADTLRSVRFPDQTLGEDILFMDQLRSQGAHVVYDPGIAVLHENREGWRTFFDYNRAMGRAAASYHQVLRIWWAVPVLRFPGLAFCAPAVVLPSIAFSLLRSRWSYLFRFLLLTPMCFVGNLVWANGFRQRMNEIRKERMADSVHAGLRKPSSSSKTGADSPADRP